MKRKSAHFTKISKERFDKAVFANTCWSGKIVISEDGSVYPCVFERDIVLGNVKEQSITEIIHSTTLENCWNHCFKKVNICKECEFRFACKDCRPLAKSIHGNLDEKNPRCTYDVYNGVWMS